MDSMYQVSIAWLYLVRDSQGPGAVAEDEADEPAVGWARWIAERVGRPASPDRTAPAARWTGAPSDAYLWGVHRPG
jgi:hypothetical protein